MITAKQSKKTIIGRAENISFVEVGANNVPAKIDTGAYRSAVHASDIRLSDDGKSLSFKLLGDHPNGAAFMKEITTKRFSQIRIFNSFGDSQLRYEVTLKIKLDQNVFRTNFSLADRSKKIYPVLVGRKTLNGRFIVDTSKVGLDRVDLKKKYGIILPNCEEEA